MKKTFAILIVLIVIALGAITIYISKDLSNDTLPPTPIDPRTEQSDKSDIDKTKDAPSTNTGMQTLGKISFTGLSSETQKNVTALANSNNSLSLALYNNLKSTDAEAKNLFISPYSIMSALSMTAEGARGKTLDEMIKTMMLPVASSTRHSSFNALNRVLNNSSFGTKNTLAIANSIWAQKDFEINPDFIKTVRESYAGEANTLDYINKAEDSRNTINKWVENHTNSKIKNLIPEGVIDTATRLILVNAVYFKGSWLQQFDKKNTAEADFTVTANKTVKVQMMHQAKSEKLFAETSDAKVLELPYSGSSTSMVIILPKNNIFAFEKTLTNQKLSDLIKSVRSDSIPVYIPRFKMEDSYSLKEKLSKMGMPSAFSDTADFGGMTSTSSLKITEVVHKTFVEVNEEGTEAAAATAVIVGITSAMLEPVKEFRADHPFIFLIKDNSTGLILFMGRIIDPTK